MKQKANKLLYWYGFVLKASKCQTNAPTYTDDTMCAYTHSVAVRHCAGEGDIAMRQSKLLPSVVTCEFKDAMPVSFRLIWFTSYI